MIPDSGLEFREPSFQGTIGLAQREITPPVGIYSRMWGCAAHDTAEGIHRPLYATVAAFQPLPGGPAMVLVSLELGWWICADDEWFVRGYLLSRLRLEASQLMLHLVHTHSGPSISLSHRDKPGGESIPAYLEQVRQAIGDAAEQALAERQPAIMTWTTGHCSLACNRDLPETGGSRVLCGFNPRKPADRTLLVGRITSSSGHHLGTLVNYACHPTTLGGGNRLISPDYVGAMRAMVEEATDGTPCLFLLGAAGELGPRQAYEQQAAVADRHGRQLGYAVLSALEGMLPPAKVLRFAKAEESGAALALWRLADEPPSSHFHATMASVELPLKDLPQVDELTRQLGECRDRVLAERLRRRLFLRRSVGDGRSFRMPYWVWRLGDAFVVGVPGEAHSPLQIELRRRVPHHAVAVVNIVNGYFSYFPPEADYASRSYQVEVSLFEPSCLERLVEACGRTIEAMSCH